MLIKLFLKINSLFPQKDHPFNTSKNGVLDLNYSDFEYAHAPSLIDMYAKYMNPEDLRGKKILDIGCGAGGKTVYLAEKYHAQVTGIDMSREFLSQAKGFAIEKSQEKNTDFLYCSALEMTFPEESFDYIIMSDVLEHIPNTQLLLTESLRVLKTGGSILFDFAPYYHYNGHHLWDTLRIPWLHVLTTEQFRIALYKETIKSFPDGKKRYDLRVGQENGQEKITYLNKITLNKFQFIISELLKNSFFKSLQIDYFMLKNKSFFLKIPILRELFIRHIVGMIKK